MEMNKKEQGRGPHGFIRLLTNKQEMVVTYT